MDQSLSAGHVSVLSCFPPSVGRDVAIAVIKSLEAGLGNPNTRSLLRTDRQVKWTMEVLCYGLTLPLDRDTVKLCVEVYTDWLMALVSQKSSTPPPISRDPNLYAQRILRHLYILFLPRSDQVSLVHLSLCQQVLTAVWSLARDSSLMTRDTWETLLHFLLRINHAILAPPTAAGSISNLSMAVLLKVWLLSSSRCFPSRSLWQTCRQMMSGWRHQPAVVHQWSRVIAALTSRLLPLSFGLSFPPLHVLDEDAALVPADMEDERVPHTWLRFLHMFSNPVELCHPAVGTSSPPPAEEPFRDDHLPDVFFTAMTAISRLVDAFLGVTAVNKEPSEQLLINPGLTTRTPVRDRLPSIGVSMSRSPFKDRLPAYGFSRPRSGSAPPNPVNIVRVPETPPSKASPPLHKKRPKAANVSTATKRPHMWRTSSQLPPSPPSLGSSPRPSPSPLRCNMDSLLHLFGSWLFDAALIGKDTDQSSGRQNDVTVMSDRWAAGRAEACGTLCRIFTCKKTTENILSVYLSRFYLVLLQSLQVSKEACPHVLASVLLNSTSLFCCDLKGVNLLLPPFISAVEHVLLDRELKRFKGFVSSVDLRRASIFILLSLLPLPLHFGSVQSQVSLDGKLNADDVKPGNFLSLKPRLANLVIGAVQTETDTCNTQLLLAAILILVQETAGLCQQEVNVQHGGPRWSQRASGPSGPRRIRSQTVQPDETAVLWVHIVRLLTQRLTCQWRNDSAVCLSALEVLGGLAKVEVQVEESERRHAVSSVCTYIVFQCSRPPPLHSRDLHSIIVAGFHCLNTWLTQHPALLNNQECLSEVLEIVELGISGSKSRNQEEVRSKEEKELNPASLRVKEAAESTLSCVMQVSGACKGVDVAPNEDALTGFRSLQKFRYFVVDSSVILAMMERGPEPEQEDHPALTVVIRGPSGCHTWSLKLRLQPRDEPASTQLQQTLIPERRSAAQEDAGKKFSVKAELGPENTERTPSVRADLSIPDLCDTVSREVLHRLGHLHSAIKSRCHIEARTRVNSVVMTTCRPPPPVTHFQPSRLFLSHMGLLTPESIKDPGLSHVPPQLVLLDSSLPGFYENLRALDQLPSRTCDSAFIFYMRGGQKTAAEILRNVEHSCSVQSHFLDFLSCLGWPVDVHQQQVGGVSTSSSEFPAVLGDSGGSVFDGRRFVLKSTDALTEINFIVPSLQSYTDWLKSSKEAERPTDSPTSHQCHSELSPDSVPKSISGHVEGVGSSCFVPSVFSSESKLFIVWMENFEDIESFPLSELLSMTRTQPENCASNVQLIFIHPMKTGLFKIRFHGNTNSKLGLVVPLVNGSMVSKRSLGFLLREMVVNCCHRRRLESDSAPPPHIRRKHMIIDIILRYRSHHSEPAFYSAMFHDL